MFALVSLSYPSSSVVCDEWCFVEVAQSLCDKPPIRCEAQPAILRWDGLHKHPDGVSSNQRWTPNHVCAPSLRGASEIDLSPVAVCEEPRQMDGYASIVFENSRQCWVIKKCSDIQWETSKVVESRPAPAQPGNTPLRIDQERNLAFLAYCQTGDGPVIDEHRVTFDSGEGTCTYSMAEDD